MNEIRARHLVERAALRLREDLRLTSDSPPPAATASPPTELPAADLPAAEFRPAMPVHPEPPPGPAPAGAIAAEPVAMDVMQKAGLVLGGNRSRIVEEFSVTAGALLRGLRAARPAPDSAPAAYLPNLLLVTSARPGEGKTFSALNLAATIAHNGLARVVLVDVDSKPASLSALLGVQGRRGLIELADDPTLAPPSLLVGTAVRDLSLLPIGARSAGGLAPTRRLSLAIERLARSFAGHVIVLDAPPCLATSEPAVLAPLVGLIAMVVEAERTQRGDIEAALDLVATCPSIMLVLNKIRARAGHAFGYYDYYGT